MSSLTALDVRSFRCKGKKRTVRRHLSGLTALRRHRPSAAQASAVSADGRPRKTLNAADFGAQSATERDHVFFVEERSDPFLRDSPLKFREGFAVARK
jgi:hypothetical protein